MANGKGIRSTSPRADGVENTYGVIELKPTEYINLTGLGNERKLATEVSSDINGSKVKTKNGIDSSAVQAEVTASRKLPGRLTTP